jgi:hypothetical protein
MSDSDTIVTYVLEYPGTNLVKIGQAKYYADRFAQLVTGSPIYPVPVCVFRGAKHEHELHARFAHLRHHNEFFYYTVELQAYLKSDECAGARMTHEEAWKMSPRVVRSRDRKDLETAPSLETSE